LTARRREILLSAAFAVWGFTIAIALITFWRRPAPPDQLMGAAKMLGLDAHGPLRWMLGLMILPIALPLALRPIARRLADGRAWARNAVLVAPLVTLWLTLITMSIAWAIIPCAIVIVVCTLLRDRDVRFTRNDVVLVPVMLTTLFSLLDVSKIEVYPGVVLAALLVFALRIAIAFIPSPLPPAFSFLLAPLGLVLQTGFFARDQRYFGWHALALVFITPFLLRFFLRNARRARKALILAIYPLSLFAYWNAISASTAEGKPRVNFFEDGHSLLPASEYLRGERPYRDILPAHGLLEDGLFDAAVFRVADVNAGTRTKAREVVGTSMAVALYALAFAATGSAEAGFLAVLLSIMMGVFAPTIRMLPGICALACMAAGVRWRRPRCLAWAAFFTVVAGATSIDFGAYAFLTLLVASARMRIVRPVLIGLAAGAIPLLLGLAVFGILGDFVRGTFFEVPAVAPAYISNFFTAPPQLAQRRFFPEALAVLLDPQVFPYLAWAIVAIFAGAVIVRRWPRRFEPLVLLAFWVVLTGISYAERHHHYSGMVLAVLLVAWIARTRNVIAIAIAVILANPTTHASVLGVNRRARGPMEGWVEVRDVPRASGALWQTRDAAAVEAAKKYVSLSLQSDETFLDFTNTGILYFLFRRDCPIRWYETAFFETDAQQREVIARIESNPKVRAVLMHNGTFSVDGVPDQLRAPLVYDYIRTHFEPDFEEGDIAFWRRVR
jgi:hypothetical protein